MSNLPKWLNYTIMGVMVVLAIIGFAISNSHPVPGMVLSGIGFVGILVYLIMYHQGKKAAELPESEDDDDEDDETYDNEDDDDDDE